MKKNLFCFRVVYCYVAGWACLAAALGLFVVVALAYPDLQVEQEVIPGLFFGLMVLIGYTGFSGMVLLRLGKSVSRALQKNGAPSLLCTPLMWSNGMPGLEKAYRELQAKEPAVVQQIRYFVQQSGPFSGLLALLPGRQMLGRLSFIQRFLKKPMPLRAKPQIQPYVWGRKAEDSFILNFLDTRLDASQQDSTIAELWFGAHKKNPSRVGTARHNMDLDEFSMIAGEALLGTNRREIGQLFKVLDAVEPLSIQMHERYKPDSKNECWMIVIDQARLARENQDQVIAELFLGFRPVNEIDSAVLPDFAAAMARFSDGDEKKAFFQEQFGQALEKGQTDKEGAVIKAYLNIFEVRWEAGQVELYLNGRKQSTEIKEKYGLTHNRLMINVPGATVHALAYGTIYELQETADKTLRLYDQGRNDPNRPLHIEESIRKLDFTPRPPLDYVVAPVRLDDVSMNLIRTPLYAMDEIFLHGTGAKAQEYIVSLAGSYHMLVVAKCTGENNLVFHNKQMPLRQGDMFVVPVQAGAYTLAAQGELMVLKAYEASPEEILELQPQRGKHFWEADGFFSA